MKYTITYILIVLITCFSCSAKKNDKTSSSYFTSKAWEYYEEENYKKSLSVIEECIKLHMNEALNQQQSLNSLPKGDKAHDYWALNDVGTCLYIKSEILEKKGKEFREELISTLKLLSSKLKYSQCWDKNGWFWQPAVEAKSKLIKIEFDALLNE